MNTAIRQILKWRLTASGLQTKMKSSKGLPLFIVAKERNLKQSKRCMFNIQPKII